MNYERGVFAWCHHNVNCSPAGIFRRNTDSHMHNTKTFGAVPAHMWYMSCLFYSLSTYSLTHPCHGPTALLAWLGLIWVQWTPGDFTQCDHEKFILKINWQQCAWWGIFSNQTPRRKVEMRLKALRQCFVWQYYYLSSNKLTIFLLAHEQIIPPLQQIASDLFKQVWIWC